ncbi:hypothetical protein [Streptosporangium sp. V21-05]|uniref:hypothetical protein n=1 Tax=Streptosporangium sp. V21-05 TaxID=3446115 RepID=UPI003F52C2E6
MADVAERIEQLCLALDDGELPGYAARAGVGEVLARVLAAVAERGPDPALTPDLDALDDAFARFGLGMPTQAERAYEPLDGLDGHPVVQVWTCPAPRPCTRIEAAADTSSPPCAATGSPLALTRLPT